MASQSPNPSQAALAVAVVAAFNKKMPWCEVKRHIFEYFSREERAMRDLLDNAAHLTVQKPKERVAIAIVITEQGIRIFFTSSDESIDRCEVTRQLEDIWRSLQAVSQSHATNRRYFQSSDPLPDDVKCNHQDVVRKLQASLYARFQRRLRLKVQKRWEEYLKFSERVKEAVLASKEEETVLKKLNQMTEYLGSLAGRSEDSNDCITVPPIFTIVEGINCLQKDPEFRCLRMQYCPISDEGYGPNQRRPFNFAHWLEKIVKYNNKIKLIEKAATRFSFQRIFKVPFSIELGILPEHYDVCLPHSLEGWDRAAAAVLEERFRFNEPKESLQTVFSTYGGNKNRKGDTIRVRVHPELELLEHLHRSGLIVHYNPDIADASNSLGMPTYVGTSKPPCAACYLYFRMRGVCIQETEYEYTFPWHPPCGASPKDEETFLDFLQDEAGERLILPRIVCTGKYEPLS